MKVQATDSVYEPLTDEKYQQIVNEGKERLKNERMAESVKFNREERTFCFKFNDKTQETIQIDNFEEFTGISDKDLNKAILSPAGTALCLEKYDLDISVEGLIRDNKNQH